MMGLFKPNDKPIEQKFFFSPEQIQRLFSGESLAFFYNGKEYFVSFLSSNLENPELTTYALEKDWTVIGSFDFDQNNFSFHSLDSNSYDNGVCGALLDALNSQRNIVKTAWELANKTENTKGEVAKVLE